MSTGWVRKGLHASALRPMTLAIVDIRARYVPWEWRLLRPAIAIGATFPMAEQRQHLHLHARCIGGRRMGGERPLQALVGAEPLYQPAEGAVVVRAGHGAESSQELAVASRAGHNRERRALGEPDPVDVRGQVEGTVEGVGSITLNVGPAE